MEDRSVNNMIGTSDRTLTEVLIVGAGNAAMAAAVSAKGRGAAVTVLEKAPQLHRGGNSALTVHMRFPYRGYDDLIPLMPSISEAQLEGIREKTSSYSEQQYWDDIMSLTDGLSDPDLADQLVTKSASTIQWMRMLGHRWKPTFESPLSANPVSFEGGGYSLLERWFAIAERLGISVEYETTATDLIQNQSGGVIGVRASTPMGTHSYYAKAVILACGSFESNPAMRLEHLGPGWDNVKLRGVPYNTGDGLNMALDLGAMPFGSWSTCHASPQGFDRPAFDLPGPGITGDFWSRYAYPFSIMINIDGRRFVDEGETWRGLTYAKMGRAILAQPDAKAFQLFDSKHRDLGILNTYPESERIVASNLEVLGERLKLRDQEAFLNTIADFNSAVGPEEFNAFRLDGKATIGTDPGRSNWALPMDDPPFEAYPVTCGMTFCYGGLRVTETTGVLHTKGYPIPGLYAAGEMVGGLWAWNYPSGGGMMAGAVFGRLSGDQAAAFALSQ